VLAVTILARQVTQVTTNRLAAASHGFLTESQWVAEGIAAQWQERSKNPRMTFDDLLVPCSWSFPQPDGPSIHVDVWPSSAHNKLSVPNMGMAEVTSFWLRQPSALQLAPDLDRRLFETGSTMLEVVLDPRYLSAHPCYVVPDERRGIDIAPADVMTVWGDGKVDLNRCALEVLKARLKGFTDIQVAGILRVRGQGPIKDISGLTTELSLSEDQQHLLAEAATVHPTTIELVIRIKKGGLSALYHAVLTVGGQVQEVRPIL
jgi:hypothetical protein